LIWGSSRRGASEAGVGDGGKGGAAAREGATVWQCIWNQPRQATEKGTATLVGAVAEDWGGADGVAARDGVAGTGAR